MSPLPFEASSNPADVSKSDLTPFLIQLATLIPVSKFLATSTRTAGREEQDEDADTDEIHPPHPYTWESAGAIYDEHQQVWLMNGHPLVHETSFQLGTSTVTEIVKEEQDEDKPS